MRQPYPPIKPYAIQHLPVSDGHTLYIEESGNPKGIPAVYLHGGPGSNTMPFHRQLFDPTAYRIILFDQRGCGQSTPLGSIEDNTTWHLVADMEAIREALGINQWLVCGGSWGSTLALAYAQTHPARVHALVLRGIFLCRPSEVAWTYQFGTSELFPEQWQAFQAPIPPAERHDMLAAYHRRIHGSDEQVAQACGYAWSTWELSTSTLIPKPQAPHSDPEALKSTVTMARIETHYFVNNAFFEPGQGLLDKAHLLKDMPTWIIQGHYDVVCPPVSAWELHQAMPHATFWLVDDAGHSITEPGITDGVLRANDAVRDMVLTTR